MRRQPSRAGRGRRIATAGFLASSVLRRPRPAEARFELSARDPDRQAVSSWFTPAPRRELPRFPIRWGGSSRRNGRGRCLASSSSRRLTPSMSSGALRRPSRHLPHQAVTSRALRLFRKKWPGRRRERHADSELARGPLKAIQVHDSYLIAETKDGMMVIDQHALHERILYEELRQRVASGKAESQGLLVPEPVHLSADEAAAILEHRELLAELGLDVEPFGGDTVLVRGTPVMLAHLTPDRLVRDLAEQVHTHPIPPSRDALVAELLHMVACKAAVKAGDRLSPEEIEALLERRHLVADSHHCPHGRPTALVFTKAELEKQFGRI